MRHIRYPRRATVLWRWVDAPQGAEIAALLHDPDLRLTESDYYTLMTYARRCVLAALRTADLATALAAFEALSRVDMDRVDWRDVTVVASLASYGARRTGLDPELVLTGPVRRATPAVAELLTGAAISEAGTGGYHELRTTNGPVLIEVSGPVRGAVALLKTALGVAAAIEEDGRYEVGGVGVEREVPAVWLDGAEEERRRLKRCVSVRADPPDSDAHFLLVFLVEAATDADAAAIAAAAQRRVFPGAVELGIAVDRRCAVVIARSAVHGVPPIEDDRSLTRLTAPIIAAMRGT